MVKKIGSVMVNTDAGQILQNGVVIQCPYDIYDAFRIMSTYEWVRDMCTNDDEEVWNIATETRNQQNKAEEAGYPITEGEALDRAIEELGTELRER